MAGKHLKAMWAGDFPSRLSPGQGFGHGKQPTWPGLALAEHKFGVGVGSAVGEMLSSVLVVSHQGIVSLQCP